MNQPIRRKEGFNRDNHHRCKLCGGIFPDEECPVNPHTKGLLCPVGCVETFNQPPYESPFDDYSY